MHSLSCLYEILNLAMVCKGRVQTTQWIQIHCLLTKFHSWAAVLEVQEGPQHGAPLGQSEHLQEPSHLAQLSKVDLIVGYLGIPSGNQTWQWKILYEWRF